MDTPKPLQKPAHLLDDLESIRQLLGDDNLQPPLLTDTVDDGEQEQIPMLFEAVDTAPPAIMPGSVLPARPSAAAPRSVPAAAPRLPTAPAILAPVSMTG